MDNFSFSEVVCGTGGYGGADNPLMQMLMCDSIQPGTMPSYTICKEILANHPLGQKLAEAPIVLAQSQERVITIQDAPNEVAQAFKDEWEEIKAEEHILNVHALARAYGISSIVLGVKDFASDKPVDMETLWEKEVFFNELDPLNTAGSLVLSQQPNDPKFQSPSGITTNGQTYHPSRCRVVMNERPIYILYTNSGFGFVGRSVYQRILFPLKSFIRSMIANDMIQAKLIGIIINAKPPGGIVNQAMAKIAAWKRWLVKRLMTGEALTIDLDEKISTFPMENVDGAGTYSRTNILKDIATGANMPAQLIENETMVSGFGEGTEDSKKIALYVISQQRKISPEYKWFDNIVQYRAWNPKWYERVIQTKYPERYGNVDFKVAFSEWRQAFSALWPSMLIETDSEATKKDQIKLEAVVAIVNLLLTQLDPMNKATLIQWACDCFGENKKLFPHEPQLDIEALEAFQQENQQRQDDASEAATDATSAENKGKFQSFGDSAAVTREQLAKLRGLVEQMAAPRVKSAA
jgi:hypothetical protein